MKFFRKMTVQMRTYICAIVCSALGLGLSDQVFANFFKDAYQVTTIQRSVIEGPRELPGILCVFITAALSFLGDGTIIILPSFSCLSASRCLASSRRHLASCWFFSSSIPWECTSPCRFRTASACPLPSLTASVRGWDNITASAPQPPCSSACWSLSGSAPAFYL